MTIKVNARSLTLSSGKSKEVLCTFDEVEKGELLILSSDGVIKYEDNESTKGILAFACQKSDNADVSPILVTLIDDTMELEVIAINESTFKEGRAIALRQQELPAAIEKAKEEAGGEPGPTPTPTYTITWKNYDGTVLETDTEVEKGTTPTYDGATPTKPATAEYTYTFSGWQPTVGPAKKNQVYTAQFEAVPIPPTPTHTIIWQDYDGTTLETDTVQEGVVPTYDGETPTREDYNFTGWSPTPYAADKNETYVAQYEPVSVDFSSVYLNCYANKNDQGNEIYYFTFQVPGNNETITLEFDGLSGELHRQIDINGTTTSDTITNQIEITEYSNYVNALFDPNNTAQFTEEQFNHLKDITEPEDAHIYTVEADPNNTNKVILEKKLAGNTVESFTWEKGYGDVGGEYRVRTIRTIGGVEDLSTEDTYTSTMIQNLCWNTINNYGGQFYSGGVYNFIKNYTLDENYIDFWLHDENAPTYYESKTYKGSGAPYVEVGHSVEVTTNPDTIVNEWDSQTYTITGQEATNDIAWILSHTEGETGSTPLSEQDYYRFQQLGVETYQVGNIDVSNSMVSISDNYEGYEKETYRANESDGQNVLEIVTRASYTSQTVSQRYEVNSGVYQAVADYCSLNSINPRDRITSTQYGDLKAIFETYKGDPIYNYSFNLWSNPSDNDMVFQITQQREVANQWEDWNKVEIHKDGNGGYYVTEMNNGGGIMQVGNMSASQYADFGTAATAIGYDVTNQGIQTSIQGVDFLNLKGAVESNMSTNATAITSVSGFESYVEGNPLLVNGVGATQTVQFTYAPANATNVATDLIVYFDDCYSDYNVIEGEVTSYANGTGTMVITGTRVGIAGDVIKSDTTGDELASFHSEVHNNVTRTVTFVALSGPSYYGGGTLSPDTIQVYDGATLVFGIGENKFSCNDGINEVEIQATPDSGYKFSSIDEPTSPITENTSVDVYFSTIS